MKSTSELTDYYYTHLGNDLKILEEDRKAIQKRIAKAKKNIIIIAFIIVLFSMITGLVINIINVIVVAFIATYIAKHYIARDYVSIFKRKIIKSLVELLDKNLHFSSFGTISSTHFKKSGLFSNDKIGVYTGNDHVRGTIDGVKIEFSDLNVSYKSNGSRNVKSVRPIFRGLFIMCEFNKHFHGSTFVVPDTTEKFFGPMVAQWMQSNKLGNATLIQLDDPEFEKHFAIYSDDQIEAHYLLTPTMMERLLAIKKQAKSNLSVSFRDDKIYLAIHFNKDLFEPDINQSLLDYKQAAEYIETLRLAIGVVEELKLNQKLWSKQ